MFNPGNASFDQRNEAALRIAESVNKTQPPYNMLEELNSNGVIRIPRLLSSETLRSINKLLDESGVYNSHVPVCSDHILRNKEDSDSAISCYPPGLIFTDLNILSLSLNPLLLDVAESYIGCVPTIYSFNCFYSKVCSNFGSGASRGTQDFHRDYDDFRFLTLFVYLNHVGVNNGPHCYKTGSHKGADGEETVLTGWAGDAFLADSYGLHKGLPLVSGHRRMLWIRYGLNDNHIHYHDQNDKLAVSARGCPVVLTDKEKYVTRLFFREDM